ncbi:MAG TPA: hypothetical protein VGJ77_01935 [Gaiellaceae bacterium]|jgi:hypothetical protein
MSDEKIESNDLEEQHPELLPERDVMSLIDPAAGLLGGSLPTADTSTMPIDPQQAGAGDATGVADQPSSLAQQLADAQASQSGSATVSDQPQSIPVESTDTASSST